MLEPIHELLAEAVAASAATHAGAGSALRPVALGPLLRRLAVEYREIAVQVERELRYIPCRAVVATNPLLLEYVLRQMLQHALARAPGGRIVLGVRHRERGELEIQVIDTAPMRLSASHALVGSADLDLAVAMYCLRTPDLRMRFDLRHDGASCRAVFLRRSV